jgi:hypothetical protein
MQRRVCAGAVYLPDAVQDVMIGFWGVPFKDLLLVNSAGAIAKSKPRQGFINGDPFLVPQENEAEQSQPLVTLSDCLMNDSPTGAKIMLPSGLSELTSAPLLTPLIPVSHLSSR